MKNKDYSKLVIPKDDYMATIVHAEFAKTKKSKKLRLYLWWVIDTGTHIGHKISEEYPCTDFGDMKLKRMCNRTKTKMYGSVKGKGSIFPLQFLGFRGKISVDIKHEGNFIRNIITYHQVALHPPEQNVIKNRSVDHFFKEQNGRKLPI